MKNVPHDSPFVIQIRPPKSKSAACARCKDGTCPNCKMLARVFRLAVRRAADMPKFLETLKLTGEVRSLPTDASPEGRILEGALPSDPRIERVLMAIARSVQGVIKFEGQG